MNNDKGKMKKENKFSGAKMQFLIGFHKLLWLLSIVMTGKYFIEISNLQIFWSPNKDRSNWQILEFQEFSHERNL